MELTRIGVTASHLTGRAAILGAIVLLSVAIIPGQATERHVAPGNAGPSSEQRKSSAPQVPVHYPYTNRLIHEKSPYLLLHAHNPVDWHPWGEEAFAKAKRENKPIFLVRLAGFLSRRRKCYRKNANGFLGATFVPGGCRPPVRYAHR